MGRPFAEHRLRRVLPERAGPAVRRLAAQRGQAAGWHIGCFVFHRGLVTALPFGRQGRLGIDHVAAAAGGFGDQRFNQLCFGKVPPITLRHFGFHRLHVEAGGIEDAGVISAPDVFEPVAGGCGAFVGAGREGDGFAVPVRAEVRRQDRPSHVGKAPAEERGGRFDDMMRRFEPGDEAAVRRGADLAKADEGFHLVLVVTHCFRHAPGAHDVGIGRDLHQVRLQAQPPQQPIEQGEAFGIAMQDAAAGEIDECGRNVEAATRRGCWFERRGCEQLGIVACNPPRHVVGWNVLHRERAGGGAPAVEIGFGRKHDMRHGYNPN